MKSDFKPVVRNIKTNDLYQYNGGNNFTNIRTDVSGDVSDDAAKKTFVMSLDATIMINEYPNIIDFIKRLNLIINH